MNGRAKVGIGMPVRNGAAYLDEALAVLTNQTFRDIEILISDNDSNDRTAEICRRYAEFDSRIRYVRQERFLTASENFQFVLDHLETEYFCWAAHDDRWSPNFIESLVATLSSSPDAILAFPRIAMFSDHAEWRASATLPFRFESSLKTPLLLRIARQLTCNNFHIYGLFRRQALLECPWQDSDYGADIVMLTSLACLGDFTMSDAATFYYYHSGKIAAGTVAIKLTGKPLRRFPELRLAQLVSRFLVSRSGLRMPVFGAGLFMAFTLFVLAVRFAYRFVWLFRKIRAWALPQRIAAGG